MTSDGISAKDWDKVKNLAAKIVNAEDDINTSRYTDALLVLLDKLSEKYGELPSILATKADYIADPTASIDLFIKAFNAAKRINDYKNMTYIASSLAEAYFELHNISNCRYWLSKLNICLKTYFDATELKTYKSLRGKVAYLSRKILP